MYFVCYAGFQFSRSLKFGRFSWFMNLLLIYVATNIIVSHHSCAPFFQAPLHIPSANLWRYRLGDNGIPLAAAALRFCGYGMRVSRVLIWPAMARDIALTWKLGSTTVTSRNTDEIRTPCLEGCVCWTILCSCPGSSKKTTSIRPSQKIWSYHLLPWRSSLIWNKPHEQDWNDVHWKGRCAMIHEAYPFTQGTRSELIRRHFLAVQNRGCVFV